MTLTAAALAAVLKFCQGDHYRGRGWGFQSSASDTIYLPAEVIVGRRVNIGTKDGHVFEKTWVTAFDETMGTLVLAGGLHGSPYWPGPPRPLAVYDLPLYDVARGYTHAPPVEVTMLTISAGAIQCALDIAHLPEHLPGKTTGYIVGVSGAAATVWIRHVPDLGTDRQSREAEALLSACRLTLADAGYTAATRDQAVTVTVK